VRNDELEWYKVEARWQVTNLPQEPTNMFTLRHLLSRKAGLGLIGTLDHDQL
jgi:hypothetical protein